MQTRECTVPIGGATEIFCFLALCFLGGMCDKEIYKLLCLTQCLFGYLSPVKITKFVNYHHTCEKGFFCKMMLFFRVTMTFILEGHNIFIKGLLAKIGKKRKGELYFLNEVYEQQFKKTVEMQNIHGFENKVVLL